MMMALLNLIISKTFHHHGRKVDMNAFLLFILLKGQVALKYNVGWTYNVLYLCPTSLR